MTHRIFATQEGYYPNLSRADIRKWWGSQFKSLCDKGLEFVWLDMTSPCIDPRRGDMKRPVLLIVLALLRY
jgi:alpha-glucosidase (family GH31 glycosyl hydrolase)